VGSAPKPVRLRNQLSASVLCVHAFNARVTRSTGKPQDPQEEVLADADAKVRQRACMAIGACVRRDAPDRRSFAERLLEVLGADQVQEVRAFAASALLNLALKDQLAQVTALRADERALVVRQRLDRIIRRLGGTTSGAGE
jgi:hypothetical protein